jgi:protein SCO1
MSKRRFSILRTRIFFVTLSVLFTYSALLAHQFEQKPIERREVSKPIKDFSLIDQSGQKFESNKLRGKVMIVAFAYTTCPDVCPLITAAMRQVQINLTQRERENSYLVTVTTDPEVDSPKVLAAYAKRFEVELSGWSFLTGDQATLEQVWKSFGVGVVRKARGLVDHTPLTAILDRQGTLRIAYVGASPDPKSVLHDVRRLLTQDR